MSLPPRSAAPAVDGSFDSVVRVHVVVVDDGGGCGCQSTGLATVNRHPALDGVRVQKHPDQQ